MVGFTFCGRHSFRDFGIYMKSKDRTLLPERRRRQLEIPLRHGLYTFSGATYDIRVHTISCCAVTSGLVQFRQRIRDIAGWLSGTGELIYDDEPDKAYTATVYSSIPLEQVVSAGLFDLVFECQPFAAGQMQTEIYTLADCGQTVSVQFGGTAETPCHVTITNAGEVYAPYIRLRHLHQDGETEVITLPLGLLPGDILELDSDKYEISLNREALYDRYSAQYLWLRPGSNQLTYEDYADSRRLTLELSYRPNYV